MLFDGRNGGHGKRTTAVVHADDPAAPRVVAAAQRGRATVVRYGASADCDPRLARVEPRPDGLGVAFETANGETAFRLPMLGRYNAANAAAAFAAARALGIGAGAIVRGLETFSGVPGRLERVDAG